MKKRSFVSVRTKTILILTCILFLLIFGTSVIQNNIMIKQIVKLEQYHIAEDVLRTQNTILKQIDNLHNTAYDWAVWDDTYKFITDKNEQYTEANLVSKVFVNLNLNLMIYVNATGTIVYESSFDITEQKFKPVSSAINEFLIQSTIIKNIDPNFNIKGIINLPEGPMIIATSPILKSNEEGPVLGNFIIGSYLDEAYIKDLADQLKLQLSISPYAKSIDENMNLGLDTVIFHNISNNVIEALFVLNDINGQPVSQLTLQKDRAIYQSGKSGVNAVLAYIWLLSGLCILILSIYMRQTILLKLRYISSEVSSIGKDKDFSRRLKPQVYNDEFGIVSDKINGMLDSLQKADEGIKYNANHDPLSGLPNRRLLTEIMAHAISQASRRERMMAVVFLDLDDFKMINDTKGHEFGDHILKKVALRLSLSLRESDIISRIGGDEFIILLENIEDIGNAKNAAMKIQNGFKDVFTSGDNEVFLTCSMGISIYPTDGLDSGTLIKNADIALYKAKELGKNQFAFCSASMKSTVIENMHLSNMLHRALERNELELWYQPQFSSQSKKIIGLEALIRWNNPELGMIPPIKFIPIAEQNGLIIPIGEWVLKTACAQNLMWQQAGYPKIVMAVNLSIKQFQNHNLVETVKNVLIETGLDAKYLELEITESIAMKEKSHIIEALDKFAAMGISLAVDDFGTEYSSLNHLKNLPINRIKIALPFIQEISKNEKDEAIIVSIINLAKNLGMNVIAEGVETESQFNFLVANSCDAIQGYYFYKPLTVFEITKLLSGVC